MADTLDPAKKGASAVLSNANLTIATASGSYTSALSVTGKTSGKLYFEFTIDAVGSAGAIAIGIGDGGANLANKLSADAHSVGWSRYEGAMIFNNSAQFVAGNIGTTGAASVLAVAVDFGLHDLWIRGPSGLWNNDSAALPATGANGLNSSGLYNGALTSLFGAPLFAMASVLQGSQGTINLGGTSFSGGVPSGFSVWDSAPPATGAAARMLFG
jgi:hypothetical protein